MTGNQNDNGLLNDYYSSYKNIQNDEFTNILGQKTNNILLNKNNYLLGETNNNYMNPNENNLQGDFYNNINLNVIGNNLFDQLDKNNDNFLSYNEVKEGLNLDDFQAFQFMYKFDSNGDGVIDGQEFDNNIDGGF